VQSGPSAPFPAFEIQFFEGSLSNR
jgi:hypothetical protein